MSMPRRLTPPPSAAPGPIRLVVVDPRRLLAAGVREVLDREEDMEVVAQTESTAEAIPAVGEASPDVILVTIPHKEPAAAEAARQLHREMPDSAMVVLGGEDNDASIVEALEVGATGHVSERAEPAELVATIRRVAEGDDQLKDEISGRPDLVERLVDAVRHSILADEPPENPLSPRELEILRLVAAGQHNQEIATSLGISVQTVKNHLSTIMHKMGAPNRTRAVTYAVRQGWLVLDDGSVVAPGAAPTV
jgi:DNA-binding NarL/FixJ family response regulator